MKTHTPVLLNEALDALNIRPSGVYVDATFGRGGHSQGILKKLNEEGRLLAIDQDPEAVAFAKTITDSRFQVAHSAFSKLEEVARQNNIFAADGILFDLGVSSPQIDEPSRGFSFQADGPLDMRMNPLVGESAEEWLSRAGVDEIKEVLKNYGQERFAFKIAKAIVLYRQQYPLTRTGELARIIRANVPRFEPGQDAATRSFQAIRIFINQELRELEAVLPMALNLLKSGGRLVVITFHSLEDSIVKNFFQKMSKPWRDFPKNLPLKEKELPAPKLKMLGKVIKVSPAEILANPRARSAVLRVAEKF